MARLTNRFPLAGLPHKFLYTILCLVAIVMGEVVGAFNFEEFLF